MLDRRGDVPVKSLAGERTQGEQNTGLVEEGIMKTEVCFGVTIFSISNWLNTG